eukprot:9876008-Ditylum_brightwellii.AAC.1
MHVWAQTRSHFSIQAAQGASVLHGCAPISSSNGLWKHKTHPTMFALCVDNFGVKYYNKEDANHLVSVLQQYYQISINWEGKKYCGLTFNWHYNKGYADVSMPGYVLKALGKFQHDKPKFLQFAPHKWNQPAYGQK